MTLKRFLSKVIFSYHHENDWIAGKDLADCGNSIWLAICTDKHNCLYPGNQLTYLLCDAGTDYNWNSVLNGSKNR